MKEVTYGFDWTNRRKSPMMPIALVGALTLMVFALQASLNYSPAVGVLYVLPIWAAVKAARLPGGLILSVVAAALMTLIQCVNNSATDLQSAIDFGIRVASFSVVTYLIFKLELALEEAKTDAFLDPLTGVLNRRALAQFAHRFLPRVSPDVVVIIDCDGFKRVNDQYGHRAGDHILQMLAKLLEAETRHSDMVVRMGGDEFALILSDADPQIAGRVLGRVEATFRQQMQDAGYECSISIGIAESEEAADLDELLHRADTAMYRQKKKNRIDAFLN